MAQPGARTLPKIGVAVGIVIIAGSLLGGVALAGVPARGPGGGTGSTQPLGTEETPSVAPGVTAPSTAPSAARSAAAATGGDPAPARTSPDTRGSTGTAAVSPATTTPAASPTCWNGPGEHPPGIEDCAGR